MTIYGHLQDIGLSGGDMCGIAVAINWDGAETAVQRLIAGLLHRGDITDPQVQVSASTIMCTRRLRIVDAENGAQPKASFDKRFLVAFNGEIYNHAELRRELEMRGIKFSSHCDTEVVANVLRVFGSVGIKRLAGMYAFVAIDTVTGEFLAARDPFGVKPLYVIQKGNGFLFCSEIKPLLNATEHGEVMLLPPGYALSRDFCGPHYSLPSPAAAVASPQELDRVLAEAVRMRVPPDLPVAALFSGGIDSTLVMHYARRVRPDIPGYIAVGSGSPDYLFAKHYAEETGLDLREVEIEPHGAQTLPLIATVVAAVETFEPAVIRSSLHTYLLSQRIHQDGFRVALCGEGADELFAGYSPLEQAFAHQNGLGRFLQRQCLGMMHRANLQRVDRCSMQFQLEIREPFLDQTLVSYGAALDRSDLVKRSGNAAPVGKAPLRALYDLYPAQLPIAIRDREKMLFNEGAGGDVEKSGWLDLFEGAISDADFRDGQRQFAAFGIATKEELFYMRSLAASMDVNRIPHLRGRLRLDMPRAA
jgi:asparagine synthase (glutamine-hydrolysing)